MKVIPNPHFSALSLVLGLGLAQNAAAIPNSAPCGPSSSYPSFCDIPAVPHDIRDATAFKSVVVDTRLAGRSLERNTAPNLFTLSDTDGFVGRAEREATPPPPADVLGPADTEAFLRDARARATPPARPR